MANEASKEYRFKPHPRREDAEALNEKGTWGDKANPYISPEWDEALKIDTYLGQARSSTLFKPYFALI